MTRIPDPVRTSGIQYAAIPSSAAHRARISSIVSRGIIMSASSTSTHGADAVRQPRFLCALRSGPLSRTFAPSDAAISFVSSVDALSTTTTSTSSRKPSNERMQFAMFADSLRVVMTTVSFI